MIEHALTALAAVILWYASTGIILALGGLRRSTHKWTMAGISGLLPLAIYGVYTSAADQSAAGAYLAFVCVLLAWAWIETSFLLGYVTGPRRLPCSSGIRGWRRFWYATQTLLYHEIAIVSGAVVIIGLTMDGANETAAVTFLVLMGMRISAKLNIFLGVPYINDELIPVHLAYLKTYFRRRKLNPLFPFSVVGGIVVAGFLAVEAGQAMQSGASPVGYVLGCTLMALAVLEHLFMVIPFRDAALWSWANQAIASKQRHD